MIEWLKGLFKEEEITKDSKLTIDYDTLGGQVRVADTDRNRKIQKLRRKYTMEGIWNYIESVKK